MKPALHTYRVTHVDAQHRRRRLHMHCTVRSAAEAMATARWGTPLYMAAVRLTPRLGLARHEGGAA